MTVLGDSIKKVDLTKTNEARNSPHHVSCLVLTQDHKILLQQRGDDHNWYRFPGFLSTFGGEIEPGETPIQALSRELEEELGARVMTADVVSLGAITEAVTKYTELVHVYFWYDRQGTITGCYEGEPRYYDSYKDVLAHPKVMDDVHWLINECRNRGLIAEDF